MLISDPRVLHPDPILAMIGMLNGNESAPQEIRKGIYKISHFGSSAFLPGYEQYPDVSIGSYGVCDDPEQILIKCPEITSDGRAFLITITPVLKSAQPDSGGWRWHKWGEYIGTKKPQCEYLYDEPEIDQVYVYRIYERI